MTQPTFTIFHATDLHPDGGIAFQHSVALARDARARLITVHARTPWDERENRAMPSAVQLLRLWGEEDESLDFEAREHECCDDPVDTLLDALQSVRPDLLVVGTHQRTALGRLLSDSVSNSLAVNADLPTLFLPIGARGFLTDTGELTLRRVLIPVGNDDDFQAAVRVIFDLGEKLGLEQLELHLLHVGEPGIVESELAPERDGWTWIRASVDGELVDEIGRYAEEHAIDLVVMATRGQDGILDILRGTQTQRALQRSARPLLLVPE